MDYQKHQETIRLLSECEAVCNHCAAACLQEDNVKEMTKCIQLDLDCAEICNITASFLSRESEYSESLMRLCAEICEACATECKKYERFEHCKRCAELCHDCAEACNQPV